MRALPGKVLRVQKGVVVLSEGEPQTSAYKILSGRVEVFKTMRGRRYVLARLGAGQFFGEMSLVLESARSASVVALEDCVLRVVSPVTFNRLLRKDPESVLPLLKVLFERLRIMNLKYLTALDSTPPARASARSPKPAKKTGTARVLRLTGSTTLTRKIAGSTGIVLGSLPFRIGRRSSRTDVFQLNDLLVPDAPPYQVSRNHCAIDVAPDGGFLVQDRGSRLGTIVNGRRLGGGKGHEARLTGGTNEIVLGNTASPYRFELALEKKA